MADAKLVDYYAALNLPHDADLAGIENAYARISDELATLGDVDEECKAALALVNEAYSVLSRPELRRAYDAVFLAKEREEARRELERKVRRREWAQRAIVGALGLIVAVQAAALLYLGREEISDALSLVAGVL